MKWVRWLLVMMAVATGVYIVFGPKTVDIDMGAVERMTINEYVSDEAKTRLAREYTLDMPVSGILERMACEPGDLVQAGAVVAAVDTFALIQQLYGLDAQLAQTQARMEGVDQGKPKPEDIAAADVRVTEMRDAVKMSEKETLMAQTEREDALRELNRAKQMTDEGVSSQAVLDQAQRRYTIAEQQWARARIGVEASQKGTEIAALQARRIAGSVDDNEYMRAVFNADRDYLKAQRAQLEEDLKKCAIAAPVTGPILEKYVDSRRVLPAGTPLLKLGDLNTAEIECDVLSEDVVRIVPGAPVEIEGKALRVVPVMGKVSRIYPSAFKKISALGIEQQRVKVIIDFDNSALQLRPGTRLDVRIITASSANALAVPERAVFRAENQWYIFSVIQDRVRRTPVTVGLKNDRWIEIREGLKDDAVIVRDPTNELKEGVSVRPRK